MLKFDDMKNDLDQELVKKIELVASKANNYIKISTYCALYKDKYGAEFFYGGEKLEDKYKLAHLTPFNIINFIADVTMDECENEYIAWKEGQAPTWKTALWTIMICDEEEYRRIVDYAKEQKDGNDILLFCEAFSQLLDLAQRAPASDAQGSANDENKK